MNSNERHKLIEELRLVTSAQSESIRLDTPNHWVVENLKDPASFFEHLPALLPGGSILYFEGTSIVPELAKFYEAHRAASPANIARDTIMPVPDIHHVPFSAEVLEKLRGYAEQFAVSEMFDHIKAYHRQLLLFTFHDAFTGWLEISEHVPENKVTAFCEALGVRCRREKTQKPDPEQLRKILLAFEHPDQVKIRGEPWFRRIGRWFTRK